MDLSKFTTHFPLLCARSFPSKPPHELCGFINIGGMDREVRIHTPHFPDLKGMWLSGDTSLEALITSNTHKLNEAHSNSKTVLDYLIKLQKICGQDSQSTDDGEGGGEVCSLNESLLKCLLGHLDQLGWGKIKHVSHDFKTFTFTTRDGCGRSHDLKVSVSDDYPHDEPKVEATLPIELNYEYETGEGVLGVVRQWEETIASLQDFWDVMDELDDKAVVLDPPNPSKQHTFRRLLLGNQVNVQVTLTPAQPHSLPQCLLFGPLKHTRVITETLTARFQEWEEDRSILDNLDHVLGVPVVRRREGAEGGGGGGEVEGVECPICYSLHFEDTLPDHPCEHCYTPYHSACLYGWLCCLQSSRQALNYIIGECPNCSKSISCKIPT